MPAYGNQPVLRAGAKDEIILLVTLYANEQTQLQGQRHVDGLGVNAVDRLLELEFDFPLRGRSCRVLAEIGERRASAQEELILVNPPRLEREFMRLSSVDFCSHHRRRTTRRTASTKWRMRPAASSTTSDTTSVQARWHLGILPPRHPPRTPWYFATSRAYASL